MKIKRRYKFAAILLSFVLFMFWIESEQRFVVKGRVVEANSGKPIEGASIAIRWTGNRFLSFYSSGSYLIEEAKAISGKEGYFEIPKYFLRNFSMGVYKKGYVCWSNDFIFLKGGKGKKRHWFRVKDGMKIKLEKMTSEYPRFKHAGFVNAVASATRGLEGAGEEMEYYYDTKRKRKNGK